MATPLPAPGKYQLRSLHEEIALFDRKLAHAQNYETFASEDSREAAVEKLTAKRNLLVRKAKEMIDSGVEVTYATRPSTPDSVKDASPAALSSPPQEGSSEEMAATQVSSPFSGTALDFRLEVEAYKASRSRRKSA
jgi:biotin carboxyl carrier protein